MLPSSVRFVNDVDTCDFFLSLCLNVSREAVVTLLSGAVAVDIDVSVKAGRSSYCRLGHLTRKNPSSI